jgi:hypothetical protein
MLELGPVDSLIVFRLPCQRDETHPVSSGYIIQSDEHRWQNMHNNSIFSKRKNKKHKWVSLKLFMRYPEAYKPVKTAKHVDLLGKTIMQRKHNRNFPSSVNILYISR